jgi:LuxR family transcriptional activator of conjugal transfer of Ti plasmids
LAASAAVIAGNLRIDAMPDSLRTKLIEYADRVEDLAKPHDVLDALNEAIAGCHKLSVLGAGRFPLKFGDWSAMKIDETVYLHKSAPAGWWEEYAAYAQRGFDPGLMMARMSLAPYTWSESSRMLEPIGLDRWPFELALKYGMRDGFTCPVGGRWVMAFWSRLLLSKELLQASRAALFMAASFAAMRLERLAGPQSARIGRRARLTPRELAVLRWASIGRQVQDIAKTLGLGEETVRSHFKKAQEKLGARNRTHGVAEAMRQQLFP